MGLFNMLVSNSDILKAVNQLTKAVNASSTKTAQGITDLGEQAGKNQAAVIAKIEESCGNTDELGIYFRAGPISQLKSPVTLTPQYQSSFQGEIMGVITITDSQKVTLSLAFKDAKGQPTTATPDAPPEWFADNTEMIALAVTADGMNCEVSAVAPIGAAMVSVKATIGGVDFAGSEEVDVTAGAAATIEISAGPVTEQ
jgi:hypothetical protein